MVKNLSQRCLEWLYSQVQQNKISQIKKGQLEDLEHFITGILEEVEAHHITSRMQADKQPAQAKTKGAVNE